MSLGVLVVDAAASSAQFSIATCSVSSESLLESDSVVPEVGGVVVAASVVLLTTVESIFVLGVENAPVKPHELVNGSLGKLGEKMLLGLFEDDDDVAAAATLEEASVEEEEAVEFAVEGPRTSRVLSANFFSLGKLGLIVAAAATAIAARLVVAAAAIAARLVVVAAADARLVVAAAASPVAAATKVALSRV